MNNRLYNAWIGTSFASAVSIERSSNLVGDISHFTRLAWLDTYMRCMLRYNSIKNGTTGTCAPLLQIQKLNTSISNFESEKSFTDRVQ